MQPHSDSNARRAQLLERLGQQVETLRGSEGWQAWLESAATFRDFSFRNQLLIVAQRPDATKVAGFRAWQSLGRQVRKGERGIGILAPSVRKVEREAESGDATERVLVGFRVVRVFDIGQTTGDDLPEHSFPEVVVSDCTILSRLIETAHRAGFAVETIDSAPNEARGWWNATTSTITLVDAYSAASQTRTMIHELAHAFDQPARPNDDRATREQVAESSAYLVGSTFGIDISAASTFYLASWGGDRKTLEALASRVLDVARRLSSAVEACSLEAVA
jgi:antirestriction protein ArdC